MSEKESVEQLDGILDLKWVANYAVFDSRWDVVLVGG
jgi:hypothetical protein